MVMIFFAVLAIAFVTSTAQSRAEGRRIIKPYERWCWLITGLIWAALALDIAIPR